MREIIDTLLRTWAALPAWAQALAVVAVGLPTAFLLRFALTGLLRLLRFERLSARIGVSEFLRKGGVTYTASRLVGLIAFWALTIAALFQASALLDIELVKSITARIVDLLPGLVAAAAIIVVGLVIVGFLGNFAATIARNAGSAHAAPIGRGIRYLGYLFVGAMAMEQVELGTGILGTVLMISFAALALALALAFGLGCKDLAREAALKALRSLREDERSRGGSDMEG